MINMPFHGVFLYFYAQEDSLLTGLKRYLQAKECHRRSGFSTDFNQLLKYQHQQITCKLFLLGYDIFYLHLQERGRGYCNWVRLYVYICLLVYMNNLKTIHQTWVIFSHRKLGSISGSFLLKGDSYLDQASRIFFFFIFHKYLYLLHT